MTETLTTFGPISNDATGLGMTRNLVGGEGTCLWKQLMAGMHLGGTWNCIEYVVIPPNSSCGEHTHNRTEEIYYIVSGKATMKMNGETFEVTAGDLITTPIG